MITVISRNKDNISDFPDIVLIGYSLQMEGGVGKEVVKTDFLQRYFSTNIYIPYLCLPYEYSSFQSPF